FAIGWHAHARNLPGNIVLLASAFFGVGLLDFAHMLSYAGMPDFVTPNDPEKAIDFWLVARSLAAIALLAVALMPWRPFASAATRYAIFAAVLAATALACWLILFHQDKMPHTFIPGEGLTSFKKTSEYLIISLNLITAFALWRRMSQPQPFNAPALFGAVCVMALSEYFFTLYASVTDVFNMTGHIYKSIAYLFLYRAFFVATVETPYRQMQRSETRFRTLFESTGDAVMLVDEHGFIDCNKATLAMFGCATKEAFCSMHPADISPPVQPGGGDSRALADRNNATAMESGRHFFEWVCKRTDNGNTFIANVLLNRMELDGKMVLQATVRDITRRKQAEDVLNQFKDTLDQTLDSIFMFDENDFHFIYVNEGAIKQVGYTHDELLRMTPLDIKPEFTLARFQEMVQPLRDGTRPSLNFETIHRHKDGHDIPVEIFLQLVRKKGASPRYMAIVRDVTERKKNEARIKRLSRAYRLLSHVNEAIVRTYTKPQLFSAICNAATESGLFRLAWIGMLDESRLRVIPVASAGVDDGYTSRLNIRLDDERTGNGPIATALRTGHHVVCQDIENNPAMAPWRDEAIRRGYRSSATFPFQKAGRVIGTVTTYVAEAHFFTQDIIHLMQELTANISFALDVFAERTRREQAEDEIRQLNINLERRVAERTLLLEAANKELETFSYSVSHDLRAPLRSIDGFSKVLMDTYHDRLDATAQDWLVRVRRASQHMGHLIDDMLQLSQVSRGELKRVQIDLGALAENAVDDLRHAHPERQVRFILQEDLNIYGDPSLMRIAINNLLDNAWKYTGKTTMAEIEFGACDISFGSGVERAFFVRDNGAGFNMAYAHKLFTPFQRLHGAGEFEGTGIGLATVQRIIHRHHGKVWAEAKEGEGATLYFTLPQKNVKTRKKNGQ
ncbi:MAG: PAS domain S-box protein, partial [Gallionella sp.]|nr:PAS domain S-box protein [Gallionella sp.]